MHRDSGRARDPGAGPSWVVAMPGHASPEMLFSVCARYIPNRPWRGGGALMRRMGGTETVTNPGRPSTRSAALA